MEKGEEGETGDKGGANCGDMTTQRRGKAYGRR